MIKIFIATVILMTFVTSSVSARDLDVNCKALTSSYESYDALYDAVREANTTNVAPANFYDTIACECRMRPNQTVKDAISKAIEAINAGLWTAEPMHHNLTAQEQREAGAFTSWIKGRGTRPRMHGLLAWDYTRGAE